MLYLIIVDFSFRNFIAVFFYYYPLFIIIIFFYAMPSI